MSYNGRTYSDPKAEAEAREACDRWNVDLFSRFPATSAWEALLRAHRRGAVLEAAVAGLLDAMDQTLGVGWRDDTLGVTDGDAVNHAWDQIVEVAR
uniref:Uncharacterized protein n=1 Tax=viral metagenome TaxID=1070528 RepID=A0A6M3LVM9_9ZZZZ